MKMDSAHQDERLNLRSFVNNLISTSYLTAINLLIISVFILSVKHALNPIIFIPFEYHLYKAAFTKQMHFCAPSEALSSTDLSFITVRYSNANSSWNKWKFGEKDEMLITLGFVQ